MPPHYTFEGDSVANMYIGNWADYETIMMEKHGKDLTPHRVKYRTLKRQKDLCHCEPVG